MKNNILEYKGYHSKVEFCAETFTLRGKIDGIQDLVTFESSDVNKIEREFRLAVDDYLDFCKMVGKDPDKEYKGTFNVRISPDLHRKLAEYAYKNSETLNCVVEKSIEAYICETNITNIQFQQSIMILAKALETKYYHYDEAKSLQINNESKIIPFKYNNVNMKYEMEK